MARDIDRTATPETDTVGIRSFEVLAREANGWELSVKEDTRLVRRTQYSDWHRVERAISAIGREVAALEDQGWRGERALSR